MVAVITAGGTVVAALLVRLNKTTQEIHVMVNGQLHAAMHEVKQLRATIRAMQELGIEAQLTQSERDMTVPEGGHHHNKRSGAVEFDD